MLSCVLNPPANSVKKMSTQFVVRFHFPLSCHRLAFDNDGPSEKIDFWCGVAHCVNLLIYMGFLPFVSLFL